MATRRKCLSLEKNRSIRTLAVEAPAEAWLPLFAFGWDVGRDTLLLDELADAVSIISLAGQHDRAWLKMIEQAVGDLAVARLAGRQAEPDREALRIDDDVDLGRETTSGATEIMIWPPPLFSVAACWCALMEVLSIIWISPSCAALITSISQSHTPACRHRFKRL